MITVRRALVALGALFMAYMAARALSGLFRAENPWLLLAGLAFYVAVTALSVFWWPRSEQPVSASGGPDAAQGGESADPADDDSSSADALHSTNRLPIWCAILAVVCAAVVPVATAFAVGPELRTASFATWYIGAIGLLMTILMIRRRPFFAWVGLVALAVASSLLMGPVSALSLGLVGSTLWVSAAQFFIFLIDRAARDTSNLTRLQRAASIWQASQSGRQRERRVQVQRALAVAGPVLTQVVATGARLDAEERLEARMAEGQLRDEMRGPRLLDDDVRAEIERARRRGAAVTMLDEGGLDGVPEESLVIIRAELAETLRAAGSDRLYIRTSPHDRVAVTVVGRSGATPGLSDEDAVDLWREIDHPGAA